MAAVLTAFRAARPRLMPLVIAAIAACAVFGAGYVSGAVAMSLEVVATGI